MSNHYDRATALRAFDETKTGVKGLVDAGLTKIPRFFHQPPEAHSPTNPNPSFRPEIPVIDLHAVDSDPAHRAAAVGEVRRASETLGFFQAVNHGIPAKVLDEMLERTRMFNELDAAAKAEYYSRDLGKKVRFYSNFDLFEAPAANWRDSVFCSMAPEPPKPEEFPLSLS